MGLGWLGLGTIEDGVGTKKRPPSLRGWPQSGSRSARFRRRGGAPKFRSSRDGFDYAPHWEEVRRWGNDTGSPARPKLYFGVAPPKRLSHIDGRFAPKALVFGHGTVSKRVTSKPFFGKEAPATKAFLRNIPYRACGRFLGMTTGQLVCPTKSGAGQRRWSGTTSLGSTMETISSQLAISTLPIV